MTRDRHLDGGDGYCIVCGGKVTDTTESLRALMDAIRRYGVDSHAATLAFNAHVARLEAAERTHIERKHIDATPNDDYPIRILQAYRADCDMRWADTSDGEVGNSLIVALNEMQEQRAAVLDRALAALHVKETPTSPSA